MKEHTEPKDEDIANVILISEEDKKRIAKIGLKKFKENFMKDIYDKVKKTKPKAL